MNDDAVDDDGDDDDLDKYGDDEKRGEKEMKTRRIVVLNLLVREILSNLSHTSATTNALL